MQSSQKWLPVAMTANQTQAGQIAQKSFAHQRRQTNASTIADDQRVGGVQARHRRVRVGGELDEAVLVGSSTKPSPSSRGGAVGISDVAEQADHVREQQRVAEAREVVVPAQVEPEQREREDGELGGPVRPVRERREPVAAARRTAGASARRAGREVRLEVDDLEAVRERLLGMPVGDAARELVGEQEAEPDRDLANQIDPPRGKIAPPDCNTDATTLNSTSRVGPRARRKSRKTRS